MATIAKGRLASITDDAFSYLAERLAAKVPSLSARELNKALHEILDARDERAARARTAIQHHLIRIAEEIALDQVSPANSDQLLTTEQAAALMNCSRPYVAMLADNEKLPGATVTAGGHRRIPEASVRTWMAQRERGSGASDYRRAAVEGAMYDIPDVLFVSPAVRGGKPRTS